jgi:hypothetical protein
MLCIVHSDSVAFKITTPLLLLYMYGNLMHQAEFREFFSLKACITKILLGHFSVVYFLLLLILFFLVLFL